MDANTISSTNAAAFPAKPIAAGGDAIPGAALDRTFVATRPAVAAFLLDQAGYTDDRPLHLLHALDPGCGDGAIVTEMVRRLLRACRGRLELTVDDLLLAIRAIEIDGHRLAQTRRTLIALVENAGFDHGDARRLVETWCVHADFLAETADCNFDVIVANPPFLSYAHTPLSLRRRLRARYPTYRGRCDLYIPCIERCLELLAGEGRLVAITPNRWLRRDYGRPLRDLIESEFALDVLIDAQSAQLFERSVHAYPVISLIRKGRPRATLNVCLENAEPESLNQLDRALRMGGGPNVSVMDSPTAPRFFASGAQFNGRADVIHEIVADLETRLPSLSEAGCRVGIGPTTGCDKIFIRPSIDCPVEPERLLPLATPACLQDGQIEWRGFRLINPFDEDGRLVELDAWPRLATLLAPHRDQLAARALIRRRDASPWHRTNDPIHPVLLRSPKLLMGEATRTGRFVFDPGGYYPHKQVCFVTSSEWPLQALQRVLDTGLAAAFLHVHATRVRGGYWRATTKVLRRIRVPRWSALDVGLQDALCASAEPDPDCVIDIFACAFDLTHEHAAALTTRAPRRPAPSSSPGTRW